MKIFHLPDLGEGLPDAEIREWFVQVGDVVKLDAILVSVETAKAVVEVPSPWSGTIHALHGAPGDIIKTGLPLVSFVETEVISQKKSEDSGTVVGQLKSASHHHEDHGKAAYTSSSPITERRIVPAARFLAEALSLPSERLAGSGPQGTITLEDVTHKNITPPKDYERLRGVKREMARSMQQSHQTVVPVTLFDDANVSHWTKKTDISATLISAILSACRKEPALNAHFDGPSCSRKLFSSVHLGIAVDHPTGLFVPVLKSVETGNPKIWRQTIDRFKKAISDRSLPPQDLQGSTFTLSNFGVFAGRYATPIVLPPTVAILAVGKLRHPTLPLSLTFDHRAVTGGEASRFLHEVLRVLENDSV